MPTPSVHPPDETARHARILWGIVLMSGLIRTAWVLYRHDWTAPQDWEYGVIARNILAGKGFSGSAWFVPEGKTAIMAPMYVYLLWASLALFGPAAYAVLQFAQCGIGAASVWLAYRIARPAFGRRAGTLTALALALYPPHVYLTTQIHPVLLISATLLGAVWLSQRMTDRQNPQAAFWLGLGLGFGILTDPAMLCFVPLATLWPLIARPKAWRRALVLFMVSAGTAATVVAPWTLRNYLVFNRFIPVKSPFGYILWIGNHEGATGTQTILDSDGNPSHVNTVHIPGTLLERFKTMSEPDVYGEFGNMALAYMRQHPGKTASMAVSKAFYYWWFPTWYTCPRCHFGTVLTQFHHPEKVLWAVVLLLAATGMVIRRREWRQWIFLVAPLAGYTALYAVTSVGSNSRYRFPIECIVLAFAGAALDAACGSVVRARKGTSGRDQRDGRDPKAA